MSDIDERESRVTLTIEKRLGLYEGEKKEERNEVLWYVWQQNKRWLGNILDWVMPSFPNYSMHDKSHAFSVLHNIEMLLGERQIMKLSASDCFMILHVVFLHDIGMCITNSDRNKLMESIDFINFLKRCAEKGDADIRQYARLLLKYCSEYSEEKIEDVLKVKLNVYYALIYLVAEYVRKEHAANSQSLLEKWQDQSDKMGLGYGFTNLGIPQRMFHTVGACACVHNSSDFNDVMNLPMIDDGYANDYIHPRFIAVLLQLGDSLDLDNDRFHPLVKEVMGKLPWESEKHFKKHRVIRRLRISPLKITVAADCDSSEVLRLINKECNCIKNILKNAAYHWSAICPGDLDAHLPNFEPVEFRINGKPINEKLVSVEFNIQQNKAFNLLQGGNFYRDEKFVFLRELFQNAVDASKMQYWIDWTGSRWYKQNGKGDEEIEYDIEKMGKNLSPLTYPIEVELHLARRERGKVTSLDKKTDTTVRDAESNSVEYGVLVCIIDYGVGMSEEDIYAIADVGTSYEKNAKKRRGMPSWLLPTAEFGIGLQSVFLITNSFDVYTHTRGGERYKLTFQATGDKGNGHIHVTPLDEEKMIRYGTRVEVFVPYTEKKKHQQEVKTWCGKDPFSEDYISDRPFRHARELAVQLATRLDSMLGERIFPVELRLYDYDDSGDNIYTKLLRKEVKKLNYKIIIDGKELDEISEKQPISGFQGEDHDNTEKKASLEAMEEYVAWPIHMNLNNKNIIRGRFEKIDYMIDCDSIKLYMCDHGCSDVYARFGADRLLGMWKQAGIYVQDEKDNGTKIYYKGIYVESREWKRDANLLEYIDIKEKIERKYLKINRCEFTAEGQLYLDDQIYPHILDMARKVLGQGNCAKAIQKIIERLDILEEKTQKGKLENEIRGAILASAGLAVFAQIRNKANYVSEDESVIANKWNEILLHISEIVKKGKKKRKNAVLSKHWTDSTMFNIQCYKANQRSKFVPNPKRNNKLDIAHILNSNNKYAIMSVRRSRNRSWKEFLIDITPKGNGQDEGTSSSNPVKNEEDIFIIISQLETEHSWEDRKELLKKAEEWGKDLLGKCKVIAEADIQTDDKTGKWDKILKWLLGNMPSVALFFSEDSNLRINILGLEYSDTIYLNQYVRQGIWEKMWEIYKERGIERFSTIVPCGYSALEICDRERSVYYVKRGFFLYMERPYVINPFVGGILDILAKQGIIAKADKVRNQNGHDNQDEGGKAEPCSRPSAKQLLDEIYKGCGMAKEQEKQNDDSRVKTLNRLLDYICEKSKAETSKEELFNLYKMYIQEWIYLICNYKSATTLETSGTKD